MIDKRFRFGKNWKKFVDQQLNEERIEEAERSLVDFLKGNDIAGKTFLDIGCGSGLFSLVAHRLGAAKVTSFDFDSDSVNTSRMLWEKEGCPKNWTIMEGSILDTEFIQETGLHDIVYSWGVLHHTGQLWEAINNASSLVKQAGLLYIAIYNKADGFAFYPDGRFGPSSFWTKEKAIYCALPSFLQRAVDMSVMGVLILMYLVTLRNPITQIKNHKQLRGMSWSVDITDWLGGYPYECASVEEVFLYLKTRGFELLNLRCNNGLLNNEYLFRRTL